MVAHVDQHLLRPVDFERLLAVEHFSGGAVFRADALHQPSAGRNRVALGHDRGGGDGSSSSSNSETCDHELPLGVFGRTPGLLDRCWYGSPARTPVMGETPTVLCYSSDVTGAALW